MKRDIGDTLRCRLKFLGFEGIILDNDSNLLSVKGVRTSTVILPCGLHGLKGVGLSGLDFEVLKFNKDLVEFEFTAVANCSKLREVYLYEHQLYLVKDFKKLYPDLIICIRKEV